MKMFTCTNVKVTRKHWAWQSFTPPRQHFYSIRISRTSGGGSGHNRSEEREQHCFLEWDVNFL
jgi:hypothetical protein